MRRLLHIVSLVVVALLTACNTAPTVRDTEPLYTPRYASGFEIVRERASGQTLLCVKNPWQGAENVVYYTPFDPATPPQRIVAMSSSHVAMLDAVGCTDRIAAISGCRYISTPSARQLIDEERIVEAGYDTAFNFEQVKAIAADLVLLYGVGGESKILLDKLRELDIPYLYIGDYLEESPLGKAEWLVAISYLCGRSEEGERLFAEIEQRYTTLRDTQHCSAYRPRVMLNLPYNDSWFMPPLSSYAVRLIEDAGGEYVYRKNSSKASKPISLEEALLLASQADFWLNLGQIETIEELRRVVPHFASTEAVRFGRIYNNTKRNTASGGSDFWESGAIRPDLVLADLVKILHHEAPTDSLYYYKRLK